MMEGKRKSETSDFSLLKGRKISKGKVSGTALVSEKTISFYGGVDPNTGMIVEKGHDLEGKSIAGKIFVFPRGGGSTVGSYTMLRLKKNGKAPAAIINNECETIVAVGAIISDIPCMDRIDISRIRTGDKLAVDGDSGVVEIK
jgi:predicted aconitase with swiveling domain